LIEVCLLYYAPIKTDVLFIIKNILKILKQIIIIDDDAEMKIHTVPVIFKTANMKIKSLFSSPPLSAYMFHKEAK